MLARALLALALLAGCASAPPAEPEIDGPVEAVVRQVMASHQIFSSAVEIPVCFKSPDVVVSPNVVRRLHAGDKRVRPCVAKALNARGLVWVDVRSATKPRRDTYVIHAGYWCGLLCADDTEFTVQKRGGTWVVTKSEFQWIS